MTDRPAGFFAPPAWLCCTEQEMLDARALEHAQNQAILDWIRTTTAAAIENFDRELARPE